MKIQLSRHVSRTVSVPANKWTYVLHGNQLMLGWKYTTSVIGM